MRKAIEEYLEGDYVSAIYVAVPQFEGLINDYAASAGGTVSGRFRDTVTEFKDLVESRKVFLFPPFALTHVVDFIAFDPRTAMWFACSERDSHVLFAAVTCRETPAARG